MTAALRTARRADAAGPIGRAMTVLGCLGARPSPLSLAEIARRTGLPKTTVHRLLAALQAQGAVRRTPAGYVLGEAVRRWSDGAETAHRDALRHLLTPHVTELYEATRLPASLAVLDGDSVVHLVSLYPRSMADQAPHRAARVPAARTALGRLLLAYRPGPGEPEPELLRIRRDGIAFLGGGPSGGPAEVAVPVAARPDRGMVALGLAGGLIDPGAEGLLRRTALEARLTLRRHRAALP
ncbi:IclR family transcriptional regulator [Thermomonospora amylolytica]|uniref:IclR family transcriptional regulator n=1 Tax=Thermomonospora amylolytica TaxID=1411117 RepID=UPI0018E572F0|nr:helix-turn-helix domain-containing protein [Thermomonospora amylolytica]